MAPVFFRGLKPTAPSQSHRNMHRLGKRSVIGPNEAHIGEEGYLLLALVVVIFIVSLFLTIAAPTVARQLERDREVESKNRAQQYVRGIHNYYLKFGRYPANIDQLLSQNDIHFLRQQYKDPLTGGDFRLIHLGEAKTEVKGFFGEPLDGVAQGSLGSLAGSASGAGSGNAAPGAQNGGIGSNSASGIGSGVGSGSGGFSLGGSGSGIGGQSSGIGGTSSSSGTGQAGGGTGSSSGIASNDATTFQGSKGQIVGVGSDATGHGLVEWNGSANIEDWEFLYDHRTWLQKLKVSPLGGTPAANGGGSLGTLNGSQSGLGSNTNSFGAPGNASGTSAPGAPTTAQPGAGSTTPQP